MTAKLFIFSLRVVPIHTEPKYITFILQTRKVCIENEEISEEFHTIYEKDTEANGLEGKLVMEANEHEGNSL